MNEAKQYIKSNVEDYATAMTNLISEYNDSARIASDNPTEPESKWATYRKAGLYLESSSIGEVTNTTTGVPSLRRHSPLSFTASAARR
jgi:hypothetical protein